MKVRHIGAYLLGAGAALLLARLVLRLLAARPNNPVFSLFLAITAPPPLLAFLDQAQPRFGAVLEFSTLVLFLLFTAIALIVGRAGGARRARS